MWSIKPNIVAHNTKHPGACTYLLVFLILGPTGIFTISRKKYLILLNMESKRAHTRVIFFLYIQSPIKSYGGCKDSPGAKGYTRIRQLCNSNNLFKNYSPNKLLPCLIRSNPINVCHSHNKFQFLRKPDIHSNKFGNTLRQSLISSTTNTKRSEFWPDLSF